MRLKNNATHALPEINSHLCHSRHCRLYADLNGRLPHGGGQSGLQREHQSVPGSTQIASKQGDLYYHSERSLTDLYNSLSALASYHNSQIWLISADGEILLNTAAALDEENPEIIDGFDPVALGSEYYSTGTFFGYFEDKMLSVMVPVTSDFRINGYVAIHLPLQDVYQQRESLLARIDFLFLLVFGLSFVILIFFSLVVYRYR